MRVVAAARDTSAVSRSALDLARLAAARGPSHASGLPAIVDGLLRNPAISLEVLEHAADPCSRRALQSRFHFDQHVEIVLVAAAQSRLDDVEIAMLLRAVCSLRNAGVLSVVWARP